MYSCPAPPAAASVASSHEIPPETHAGWPQGGLLVPARNNIAPHLHPTRWPAQNVLGAPLGGLSDLPHSRSRFFRARWLRFLKTNHSHPSSMSVLLMSIISGFMQKLAEANSVADFIVFTPIVNSVRFAKTTFSPIFIYFPYSLSHRCLHVFGLACEILFLLFWQRGSPVTTAWLQRANLQSAMNMLRVLAARVGT